MIFSWLFPPTRPLDKETQHWIEVRSAWIIKEFGLERLAAKPIILSDDPRFSVTWGGTVAEAERLFAIVCGIMDVPAAQVELRWSDESRRKRPHTVIEGVNETENGPDPENVIRIDRANLKTPKRLLAAMAYGLARYHLIAGRRLAADVPDVDHVAELLTVFFGLGVFSADSTVRYYFYPSVPSDIYYGQMQNYEISRFGFLTARHYGYAMALWSSIREDSDYEFAAHLRPDAREPFYDTLKYLKKKKFDAFRFLQYTNPNEKVDLPLSIREPESLDSEDVEDQPREEETAARHGCHGGSCGGGHSSCHQPAPEVDGEGDAPPPDDAHLIIDDHFTVGTIALQQGEWQHAIDNFSAAIDEDPDDTEALEHRSTAYLAAGNAADAFRDADRAVELDPSELAYKARGLAAMALHHNEAAYDDFNEALGFLSAWDTNESMLSELYYLRGLASFYLQETDAALADVSRAIRRGPGRPEYYEVRAEIYEKRGDYDRADQDRELARRLMPSDEPQ